MTGEGYLTEHEFLAWVSGYLCEAPRDFSQDLLSAFHVFDKDNNGYITRVSLIFANFNALYIPLK